MNEAVPERSNVCASGVTGPTGMRHRELMMPQPVNASDNTLSGIRKPFIFNGLDVRLVPIRKSVLERAPASFRARLGPTSAK
jgi:hypothetical protein